MAGMKFFSEEVEAVIDEMPGVERSRVISRDHPKLGEIPVAEIVAVNPETPPTRKELIGWCRERLPGYKIPREFKNVDFSIREIQELVDEDEVRGDVAFCFSVLPYIEYPGLFVKWMGDRFSVVFIECQYFGDGPGNIAKDDESMSRWLREWGFDIVMLCGQTYVAGRDMYRSIWKCYRLEI